MHPSAFSIKRTACDLHLRRNVVANFGCSWEVLKLIPVLISKCQLTFWKQENEKYSFLPKKYLNNFYQHYIFAFEELKHSTIHCKKESNLNSNSVFMKMCLFVDEEKNEAKK